MDEVALLQQIPLFADLPQAQVQSLVDTLGHRTYDKGQIILHQGDAGDSLFVVHSGRVRIYTSSPEGQELSVWICDAGDFFGEMALLTGEPRSAWAEAMQRTEVLVLHRPAFLNHLLSNPMTAIRIIETLSHRLRHTTENAEGLMCKNVTQRVARKLLDLAGRYGAARDGGVLIDLDLSQEAIATLAGTTRESANRALSALREQGLVHIDRVRIQVLDLDKLAELAS
jgi:CRP/FNR family cyclic AMP-dependent transcriptional regulator